MNTQHRQNKRDNRRRRLQTRIAGLIAEAKHEAAQPVVVARIETELAGLRRTLQQYVA